LRHLTWREWRAQYKLEQPTLQGITASSYVALENKYSAMGLKLEDGLAFEYGISSLVCSLYASGFFPVTSCRGHKIGAPPHVVFFTEQQNVEPLQTLVANNSVLLVDDHYEDFGMGDKEYRCLVLMAPTALDTVSFSQVMYQNRRKFRIPKSKYVDMSDDEY
jgi:hypothetical protein